MPKNSNIPKPIHFPSISEDAARKRFKDLVKMGCFSDIYLIYTTHWAAKGCWITFELPAMGIDDVVLDNHHNPKPKPWVGPPKKNLDEDEE